MKKLAIVSVLLVFSLDGLAQAPRPPQGPVQTAQAGGPAQGANAPAAPQGMSVPSWVAWTTAGVVGVLAAAGFNSTASHH